LPSNDLGTARGVFLKLLLDGRSVIGVTEAEVCTSDHQAAGWFRVSVALGPDPVFTAAAFAGLTQVTAQILVGLAVPGLPAAAATWQSLMTGNVDEITLDMVDGTVQLSGRDFTALLIDTLSAETFSNHTSSEIAQTLAVRHGLTPMVTATTTPIGRYYQDGHDVSTLYRANKTVTEWDLLSSLAEVEGFDLHVQDSSLFFAPPLNDTLPAIWQWMPGGAASTTLTTLNMERSLALARDIVVTVQSWNSKQAQMITQTVRSSASSVVSAKTTTSATATNYVLVRPNLTPQQAMSLATQTLSDLSRHQRVVTVTMPGELDLAPRSLVLLEGTNTAFDQAYAVDEITRRVSMRDGFVQTVRAVNTPVNLSLLSASP
jgi:phage protein D